MQVKRTITEAEAEKMADRMVWSRLLSSSSYRHAESPEAQAEAEERIEREVWRRISELYEIS
jgi:hypothetical protein